MYSLTTPQRDGCDWLRCFGVGPAGKLYFPASPYTGTDGRAVALATWDNVSVVQVGPHIYAESGWLKERFPAYARAIRQQERRLHGMLNRQNN